MEDADQRTGAKQLAKILDGETEQCIVETIRGEIEHMPWGESRDVGLAKTQYKDWGKAEQIPDQSVRGRRLPKRRKNRGGRSERIAREVWEEQEERTRRTQEE